MNNLPENTAGTVQKIVKFFSSKSLFQKMMEDSKRYRFTCSCGKETNNNMIEKEINFVRPPIKESYGTVAVFEDLYGNLWDLIEPVTGVK